jgi:hypothetical protein
VVQGGGRGSRGPQIVQNAKIVYVLLRTGSFGQKAVCVIPVIRYWGKLANKSKGGVDYRAGVGGQMLSASLPLALIRTVHI